ncbi:nitroreductase family protein [Xylophilus sp.]|uniref:nitroreductase family protein n=1 Tax=Xylophilus sp. TaxID=2653893 RepID=UPI0013B8DFA3|nr:nitroreductase family protein [Xylophilus sp.]KAF1048706.1 MAG: malonic semialdehyde reductase RutE [Xylophilus sp.]
MSQASAAPPREPQYPIDPLFTRRWSPRAFTEEAIDQSALLGLLEAARWAPSGFNAQPWRFIYARRGTPAWQPIFDALSEYNGGWAKRAAALVVILSRTVWVPPGKTEQQPVTTHAFDAGAAWASLAFQATLSGWHAHGIGGFDRDRLRVALDVPQDYAIHAIAAIGRRGDKSLLPEALAAREAPNQRLPLAALAAEGKFGFAE